MAPGSEVRIRIPELHRLPTALIRILAADGIGGAKMDQVLSSEILVECVGCGIRVSIAELMALRSSPPDDSNPKINRLRLGYCARNSCLSQFYGISVGRDVGLDPELMRERLAAEIASSKPEPEELTDDESPGKSPSSDLIKRGALRIGGAALLVVVFFWWRAGAYIPGFSKKPQVFMPVEDVPAHSPAEPHSTVPVLPPPAPPGGNLNAPGRSN
ncbi:MAG: hypothetical protein J0M24_02940 [Verrucomicrobia bacterium]|nr:hypothetical protein [Verrucomicrobiota bacterium]